MSTKSGADPSECPEGPGVFVSRIDEQAVCLRSGLGTRSDSGGSATTSVESTEVTNVEHTVVVCTNDDDVALERATQAVKSLPGTLKVSRVYQLSGPSIHVDVVGNPSDGDVEWLCVGSFVTIRSLLVGPFPAEMEESYLEHVHASVDAEAVVVRSASAESYVVSGASDGAVIEFESFEVHLETELEGDLNIVLSEVEHARIVEATRDCVDRAPVCPDGKVAFLVGGVLISAPIIFGELPPEFVLSDSLTDVELGEFVELVEGAVGLGSVEQIERFGS